MPDTNKDRDEIIKELLKSIEIFAKDFIIAFEKKDRQKTLEIMIDHILDEMQFIKNLTYPAGTHKHLDDMRKEELRAKLFGFFGNLSK